jgi:hypothetical protein
MTSFSLDPYFDFTIYAIQVCFYFHPTWAPHKLLKVGKKKASISHALVRI